MTLFQEYEKLKAANQLITPGSMWKDFCGEVKIREVNQNEVQFINMPDYNDKSVYGYSLVLFCRHFTRIS